MQSLQTLRTLLPQMLLLAVTLLLPPAAGVLYARCRQRPACLMPARRHDWRSMQRRVAHAPCRMAAAVGYLRLLGPGEQLGLPPAGNVQELRALHVQQPLELALSGADQLHWQGTW